MARRRSFPTFPLALSRRVLLLGGCLLFVAIAVLAGFYHVFPGDEWALHELQQLRTGWLDDAAASVSTIGQGGIGWWLAVPWIPFVVLAAGVAARRWGDTAFLAVSTLAPVVNLGLKELVARPRPDADLWLVMETGFSFPSGHSVFAASFAGAVIWLAGRSGPLECRPVARWAVRSLLLLLILAVGFSRVYLGVHWPSDVIGGFLFGGLFLSVLVVVRQGLQTRRSASSGLRNSARL